MRAIELPQLFKQWFLNVIVSSAENLDFKIPLILDNAPNRPKDFSYRNVEIIFLQPNTSSLLATFKTRYIRTSLQ